DYGNGVKLDNLIQIGHNVEIGEHTVIAAQAGIDGAEPTASVAWFDRLSGVFVSLDPEMTKNMRESLGVNTPRPNYWPKCMRLDIPS
ncbi:MAG TPA: hypothetical protein EYQ41_11570, partial [Micavibrio sp.]|nr:hypothetical protein [Micavibrio sp.]